MLGTDELPLSRERFGVSVKKICDDFCQQSGLVIRIKTQILDEVYSSSINSLKFYNIPIESLNHYKITGHLGFWIHRLHPVRTASPSSVKFMYNQLRAAISETAWGATAREEDDALFSSVLDNYETKMKVYSTLPINEFIAWMFIVDGINVVWREVLERQDEDAKERFIHGINSSSARFKNQVEDLIWSLRYHNYSARAFAMLVEVLFKVKGI